MYAHLRCLALILCATSFVACVSPTDPLGRQDALEETQKKYTDLIRWGEVERAVRYVDPELHGPFLEAAPGFSDLRITDFEIGEITSTKDSATIEVTYKGYVVSQAVERTARETQHWYRDTIYNDWRVRPELGKLLRELQGVRESAQTR